MTYNLRVKGNIVTNVGGTTRIYAKEGFEINSNKSIIYSAPEYTYGDPEDPPKRLHPNIVSVQFLDENNSVLKQESIAKWGDIIATNILYGKKLKIKIVTKEVTDGTKIEFGVKGKSKNDSQEFWRIDELKWNLEIQNNTCETNLFSLNTLWYSEEHEYYDYDLHKTKIKAEDLNTFTIKGILNFRTFELLNEEDELKPIAYLRNYEELIGLFNADNSGGKALIDNYENKFISDKPEVFKISREFSGYLNFTENLTLNDIKERVKTDAKKLWDAAVQVVQAGILDDRPLYWARNKMQVRLKRNPIFENDIDFETSIVKDGSQLYKLIQLFEEQSRNYNDIDFSKAAGKKKLLITGFDPFVLNDDRKMPENIRFGNPLQSNPSGINALALHGKTIGDYFIQTLVCPARYKDFDEFKGGKGIIETFIKPFIQEVDMIITVSQGGAFRFDVDRFPCKNRGGFMDNMFWGKSKDGFDETYFKQLTEGEEFYETTLPYAKMVPYQNNLSDTFWTYFNQTFNQDETHGDNLKNKEGIVIRSSLKDIQNVTSKSGSGSNYLSNEIFYRVAKLRTKMRPMLATGHLHIPRIQEKPIENYVRGNSSTEDINPKITILIEEIKNIISKI
ncbi:hypothetical protein KHA90_05810 [Flavobacterium psychroterrae]|uniref:Uncharacterized protein n=1 Tax=Flavobacterium psychroterrae TaxID=2133767 RepID=A0ABS5P8G2_9FLAO|nr:hypothetical protein [Flavobacterium psychroterrae]MBS7230532.1 hypothetical protein [Flavobacterium psychroterrae]